MLQGLPSSILSKLYSLCRYQHALIALHRLLVAWVYLFLRIRQEQECPELVSCWQTFTCCFSMEFFFVQPAAFKSLFLHPHAEAPVSPSTQSHPEKCSWHPIMMLKPSSEYLIPRPSPVIMTWILLSVYGHFIVPKRFFAVNFPNYSDDPAFTICPYHHLLLPQASQY